MEPQVYKKLVKIERLSTNIRALIIDRTITIESIISELLINLLSTDKTRHSIDKYLFSNALEFEKKIKLFNSLRKAEVFEFDGDDRDIGKNLDFIIKLRNIIAHSMLNTSEEFLAQTDFRNIVYVSFTDKGTITLKIVLNSNLDKDKANEYGENLIVSRINYLIDILITFRKIC